MSQNKVLPLKTLTSPDGFKVRSIGSINVGVEIVLLRIKSPEIAAPAEPVMYPLMMRYWDHMQALLQRGWNSPWKFRRANYKYKCTHLEKIGAVCCFFWPT